MINRFLSWHGAVSHSSRKTSSLTDFRPQLEILEDRAVPAMITVSTATDENNGTTTSITDLIANPGGSGISLREAIVAANNTVGADEILFSPAINGQPINLTMDQLAISQTLTITGNGVTSTIVDAQTNSRIFDITNTAGNVTINGMTLRNGRVSFGVGGAIRFLPGAGNTLSILNSTLSGNSTSGTDSEGDAVFSDSGAVTVTNSIFSGKLHLGRVGLR
jgi:hypothetical protein